MQINEDEAEDFAEVEARDHFLEGLLAGPRRFFVDDDVVRRAWQDFVLVVEGTPFAVDGHRELGVEFHVCKFGDRAAVFHICGVAASAEDAANLHLVVRVC